MLSVSIPVHQLSGGDMLEVLQTHGFYVRSDGSFLAHAGDVVLKAEPRGETLAYPFKARFSTPDKDREKETVIQKGLDFSPFREHGEFNWNHIAHATVGLPTGEKAWYDEAGWCGQGDIVKGLPIWPGYDTDMVVQQHNQFKKGGFQRGLCCSIEGKVTKRSNCGRYIEKADVFNVALTFRPINPNCTVNLLAKAMTHQLPLIEGDSFYRALSIANTPANAHLDDEGTAAGEVARKRLDKATQERLCRHLMAKGHSPREAARAVAKYLCA